MAKIGALGKVRHVRQGAPRRGCAIAVLRGSHWDELGVMRAALMGAELSVRPRHGTLELLLLGSTVA